jgi:TPR repeat protein
MDIDKGMQEMRSAATLGSEQAQFYLGSRYEIGDGVPRDPERARRYYRLCSAQGLALCRYRLGRQLYDEPDRRERDYLEAVALFQLAAEQGLPEAKDLAASETEKLNDEQAKWVTRLKSQIRR